MFCVPIIRSFLWFSRQFLIDFHRDEARAGFSRRRRSSFSGVESVRGGLGRRWL
uniref:Uncharacterized protein MANES_08G016600 n=1 Tax=Rhizophora mucronata TaxID=61149 RepID=A0A2P2MRF9_RHIMU